MSRLSRWLGTSPAARQDESLPADWAMWRQACGGCGRSARALVEMLTPQAFSLAHQMLGRREDAQDAVQDAFMRLWRSDPGDNRGARLSTYFNTIVINRCKTQTVGAQGGAAQPGGPGR
ncbi:MAG: sigma factor [Aquabacterium sp.]